MKRPLNARAKWRQQKYNAAKRKVAFKITFDDWWWLWSTSGHWGQRGRGIGQWCMCRYGDKGAYELGNVFIGLAQANSAIGSARYNGKIQW